MEHKYERANVLKSALIDYGNLMDICMVVESKIISSKIVLYFPKVFLQK